MLVRIGKEIQEVPREVTAFDAPQVLSPVRGRALAAPSPPSASFASLTPRGGSPGHPRLAHTPLTGATRGATNYLVS